MLVHRLNQTAGTIDAVGATLGQEHLKPILRMLRDADEDVVVLDYSGIRSANASYLKATAIWLLQCGKLSVTNGRETTWGTSPYDPIPLSIYPLVTGLSAEVKEELDSVLPGFRLPCLELQRRRDDRILQAALHGPLDDAMLDTLGVLTSCGRGTATSFREKYSDRKILVTGWNNRLADLHALRLARRRREGRQWIYEAIAEEVENGLPGKT